MQFPLLNKTLLYLAFTIVTLVPNSCSESPSLYAQLAALFRNDVLDNHDKWCSDCMDLCYGSRAAIENPTPLQEILLDHLVRTSSLPFLPMRQET